MFHLNLSQKRRIIQESKTRINATIFWMFAIVLIVIGICIAKQFFHISIVFIFGLVELIILYFILKEYSFIKQIEKDKYICELIPCIGKKISYAGRYGNTKVYQLEYIWKNGKKVGQVSYIGYNNTKINDFIYVVGYGNDYEKTKIYTKYDLLA